MDAPPPYCKMKFVYIHLLYSRPQRKPCSYYFYTLQIKMLETREKKEKPYFGECTMFDIFFHSDTLERVMDDLVKFIVSDLFS